jgi:hypothetical protein
MNNTNKVLTEDLALQLHDLIVPQLYKEKYIKTYSRPDNHTIIDVSDYATDRYDGFIPFYSEIITLTFTIEENYYYELLNSITDKFKVYDRIGEEYKDDEDIEYTEFAFKIRLEDGKILFDLDVIGGINSSHATICFFCVDLDNVKLLLDETFVPRFFEKVLSTDIENKDYVLLDLFKEFGTI